MTATNGTRPGRVLLTGGNGFIGSHVAEEFLKHGCHLVVIGRGSVPFLEDAKKVTYLQGRIGDRNVLEQAFSLGIDLVVHLACSTVPGTSNADTMFDVRSNLVETLELLDFCVRHHVAKVIFASSGGTVYGVPRQLPILEESATNPICSYGIVKLALEKYLDLYHRLHGLNSVVLRISNPYGPRQDPNGVQGVISVFAARMLARKPLTVWGDGDVVRDFIHVRDLARLFYHASVSSTNGVFNAGSGVGVSINDLIVMISKEVGIVPEVTRVASRKCDVPASVLSCRKAKAAFGWEPQITMDQGIREVRDWLIEDFFAPPAPLPVLHPIVMPVPIPVLLPAAKLAEAF